MPIWWQNDVWTLYFVFGSKIVKLIFCLSVCFMEIGTGQRRIPEGFCGHVIVCFMEKSAQCGIPEGLCGHSWPICCLLHSKRERRHVWSNCRPEMWNGKSRLACDDGPHPLSKRLLLTYCQSQGKWPCRQTGGPVVISNRAHNTAQWVGGLSDSLGKRQ